MKFFNPTNFLYETVEYCQDLIKQILQCKTSQISVLVVLSPVADQNTSKQEIFQYRTSTRLKVVCTSRGGRNAAFWPCSLNILSDVQLDTLRKLPQSFSLIHPGVYEKLWSQDLVTDRLTDLRTDRG